LAVSRGNRIEVFAFDPEQMDIKLVCTKNVYAVANSVLPVRPPNWDRDLLWISTSDMRYALCKYGEKNHLPFHQ
jgi:hypothetical protein